MTPIITVSNLHNRFGSQVVHDGLSFSIYPGEIVSIVGGSGTGKSVLLQSIIGLHRPSGGSVMVNGEDIVPMSSRRKLEVQKLWGVLFQSGALFSSLTVRENVALPLHECAHVSMRMAKELADVKIELVGLPANARNKLPAQLSGGMIKRAALARALALDPKVLFLDEPTSGLDPISASAFDKLIQALSRDLGLAVVMITHDLDSIFTISDRVAVLVDQKIRIGSLQEMLKDDHPWIKEYFHGERARTASGEGRTG